MLNSIGIQDSMFLRLIDVSAKINGRYRNAKLVASEYRNIRFAELATKDWSVIVTTLTVYARSIGSPGTRAEGR
jgi:hypothetical protein